MMQTCRGSGTCYLLLETIPQHCPDLTNLLPQLPLPHTPLTPQPTHPPATCIQLQGVPNERKLWDSLRFLLLEEQGVAQPNLPFPIRTTVIRPRLVRKNYSVMRDTGTPPRQLLQQRLMKPGYNTTRNWP